MADVNDDLEDLAQLEENSDDSIIGWAFLGSLAVLLVAGAVAATVWFLMRAEDEPPPQPTTQFVPVAPAASATAPALPFADITAEAGIDFVHANGAYGEKLMPETMGGGCAFFDHDGDGDQDILFVNGCAWPGREEGAGATPRLYDNDGQGTFREVTAELGLDVSFYGMGVAIADVEGDGDEDLYFTALGPNRLFLRDADGYVEAADSGVAGAPESWSTGAAFFDADRDGDLDLFVANYIEWSREIDLQVDFRLTGVGRAYGPPMNFAGTQSYFFVNDGDGTFTERGAEAGIHVTNQAQGGAVGKGLAAIPFDFDRDGWLDVFVANDTTRNFLFLNRGEEAPGTFLEDGSLCGVAYDRDGNATGAMGVDVAFLHNDDALGLVIGNFANEMSSLYLSQLDPTQFADQAITEGIGAPSRRFLSFGVCFLDVDLDGRQDLLQANGHLEDSIQQVQPSQTYAQPPQLFWNSGASHKAYVEVPAAQTGSLGDPLVGRGAAYADIDGDGDLDVLLTQTGGPARLLRNEQPFGHHWLRVETRGKAPNVGALGALVELEAGGQIQRRTVMPSRSYLSQVERVVTFGLGETTEVDRVTVRWPGGGETVVETPAVDQVLVVSEQ